MTFSFSINLHDNEGDVYDEGVYVFLGDTTILKFSDTDELAALCAKIQNALPQIRAHEASRKHDP